MDHGVKVASVLANSFSRRCSYISESDAHVKEKAIQFGFVLGKSTDNHPRPHTDTDRQMRRGEGRAAGFELGLYQMVSARVLLCFFFCFFAPFPRLPW